MDTKENIDHLIDETLDSISNVKTVQTSPFFKEKVLQGLSRQKAEPNDGVAYLNWFTPKYQAAALICFIFLNAIALFTYESETYNENLNDFVEIYGLSETDSATYLYQN